MRLYEFASPNQISYGVTSPLVGDVQKKLESLGYSVGPPGIDSKYGPYTAAAIKAFKNDYKLNPNNQFMVDTEMAVLNDVVSGKIPRVSNPTKSDFSGITPKQSSGSIGGWLSGISDNISRFFGGSTSGGPSSLKVKPGIDIEHVRPEVISKLEKLQSQFGKQFTVTSGYRGYQRNKDAGGASGSKHLTGEAVDISWPSSEEDTIRLVAMASALGFNGIGIYRPGFVHLDIRPNKMGWGGSYRGGSWPSWANEVMQAHMGGI